MDEFLFARNIPADDMGHLYGFGLFETFAVNRHGSVFLLERHIDRLFSSIIFFNFDVGVKKDILTLMIIEYIKNNRIRDKVIRVSVTCGNKLKSIPPSITITERDNPYINQELHLKGNKLVVSGLKKNANSTIIKHKTANYLENYLIWQQAVKNGFDDVVFLNTQNKITETTKSNIFFVSNRTLFTPTIECGILPGIIRGWIIDTAEDMNIKCRQGEYTLEMLLKADEVFITNSVMGIMPVCCIGDYSFKGNLPSKIIGLFIKEYGIGNGVKHT